MSREGRDERRWARVGAPPLLAVLAAFCALTDLVVRHGVVRAMVGHVDHVALLRLVRWGELARNLGAVAGLVATTVALTQLLQVPRRGHVLRGLAIAGLGGIFIPIIAVAALLPVEFLAQRWGYLVLFAIRAGNLIALIVSITAARRRAPHGVRIASGLMATCAFFSLAAVELGNLKPIAHSGFGYALILSLRRGAEVAWMGVPILAATSLLERLTHARAWISAAASALVGLLVAIALLWMRGTAGPDFPVLLYGLVRVEFALDVQPLVYLVPIALGVGVGVGAIVSTDPARMQGGAALLLLELAGFAARTPIRLLALVLASVLLARCSLSLGRRLQSAPRVEPLRPLAEVEGELEAATERVHE